VAPLPIPLPTPLPIPSELRSGVEEDGRLDWLDRLPELIGDAAERWGLTVGAPFEPGGRTAWVAPATDGAGRDLVLKVGRPHYEARDEAAGLRAWAGHGAVILHAERTLPDAWLLLQERCLPGTTLRSLPEPEQDVIVAGILRRLWAAPATGPFRSLADMCAAWSRNLERRIAAGLMPIDSGLARAGLALWRELPASAPADRRVLLCTDLHAGNILAAAREPWLVIDPKPYVGDPTYDALQHLLNCEDRLKADPDALVRRMAGLLDLDAGRLRQWLFARCVQESPTWLLAAEVAVMLAPP